MRKDGKPDMSVGVTNQDLFTEAETNLLPPQAKSAVDAVALTNNIDSEAKTNNLPIKQTQQGYETIRENIVDPEAKTNVLPAEQPKAVANSVIRTDELVSEKTNDLPANQTKVGYTTIRNETIDKEAETNPLPPNHHGKVANADNQVINTQPRSLMIGEIFHEKYEILELLGAGGMGQVFKARHIDLGTMVAIKVVHSFLTQQDTQILDRFKREARTSAKVTHVNAVRVFDYGVDQGICFLVMEYLEGESLRKRLKQVKRIPLAEVLKIVEQLCYVLETMHRKEIIHRDLKPDNIYLTIDDDGKEVVKVLDFGLAKINTATQQVGNLTSPGTFLGTPHYMSPEQWHSGEGIDGRTDLYALGVIVFEMLAGRVPFDGENSYSLMYKHVQQAPPLLCEVAPDISPAVSEVVMRLLAKDPQQRFATAKDFLQAFSAVADNGKPSLYLQMLDRNAPVSVSEKFQVEGASAKSVASADVIKSSTNLKYFVAAGIVILGLLAAVAYKVTSSTPTPVPGSSTAAPIKQNDPLQQLAEKLGENFVLIKGGTFTIGREPGDCKVIPDCKIGEEEGPPHSVTLDDYFLCKYELTNKEYQEFVASGYQQPTNWTSKTCPTGAEDLPVTNVNWNDAIAYCEWRSKRDGVKFRLPTEEEWEHAARGDKGNFFPWGDIWDPTRVYAAKKQEEIIQPIAINRAPNNTDDVSPFKIFGMGGNVTEWTSSDFKPYPNSNYKLKDTSQVYKVIRGGHVNTGNDKVRTSYRLADKPITISPKLGFRLAVSSK